MSENSENAFIQWIKLKFDKSAAAKAEHDTQQALSKGTDPSKSLSNLGKIKSYFSQLPNGARAAGQKIGHDIAAGINSASGAVKSSVSRIATSISGIGGAIAAIGAGAGIAGLTMVTANLFRLSLSVDAIKAQFQETFGSATNSMNQFVESINQKIGITTSELQNFAAGIAATGQSMGMTKQQSAEFSQQVVKLAGDITAFKNVPFEQSIMAVISAMNGETESLKTLSLGFLDSDIKQKALIQTGKSNADQLTRQEKATAVLALVTQRLGVGVGQLDREAEGASGRFLILTARTKQLKEDLATQLLPTFEDAITSMSDFMEANEDAIADAANGLKDLIELFVKLLTFTGQVVTITVKIIDDVDAAVSRLEGYLSKYSSARAIFRLPFVKAGENMNTYHTRMMGDIYRETTRKSGESQAEYENRFRENLAQMRRDYVRRGGEPGGFVPLAQAEFDRRRSAQTQRNASNTALQGTENANTARTNAQEAQDRARQEAREQAGKNSRTAATRARQEAQRQAREAEAAQKKAEDDARERAENIRLAQVRGAQSARYGQVDIYDETTRERLRQIAENPSAFAAKARDEGLDKNDENVRKLVQDLAEAPNPLAVQIVAELAAAQAKAALAEYDPAEQARRDIAANNQSSRDVEQFQADVAAATLQAQEDAANKAKENIERLKEELQPFAAVFEEVAYGFQDAFGEAFELIFEDIDNLGSAFDNFGKIVSSALASGLGDYAGKKVKENVAAGIEEVAEGIGALANPLTAGQAPGHFLSAAKHGAAAVAWAALAGGASGAGGALQGAGRGAVSGGNKDTSRQNALDALKKGPEINIYIDGFDPKNPVHQDKVREAAGLATERYGDDLGVNYYPR